MEAADTTTPVSTPPKTDTTTLAALPPQEDLPPALPVKGPGVTTDELVG